MLASSFFDPMLGIDIHWEMVPMPAPVPTPIPNPFVGIVRDFTGLAVGLALTNAIGAVMGAALKGPVLYWGAIPATNTGTNGDHISGHILIPPGTSWAPVPKTPKPTIRPNETPKPPKPVSPDNDAVVVFGSKTVSVLGTNAVRMGDRAMSCSEPVRLPSTVVLAVPKGRPIMIGGPPSLDLMSAFMASLRTRFVSDSLHSLISRIAPGRLRNLLHWGACFFTGHPVDVASGKVVTSVVDLELPGPIPLTVRRAYASSSAGRKGLLGHGWSLSLEQAVWEEPGKAVYQAEDGREIEFDTFDLPNRRLGIGMELRHQIDRLTLRREGVDEWSVKSPDGLIRHFAGLPGAPAERALLQRITVPSGAVDIAFDYAPGGVLRVVRDSAGRQIRFTHDEHGRIVALTLPARGRGGRHIHRKYRYDAAGDLIEVTDSLGHAWEYEYASHLLVREKSRSGFNFYFEYDGLGADAWCTRTWGDDGLYDQRIIYDKRNHKTFVIDSLGRQKQYVMNIAGAVVGVVDAGGSRTSFEYDNNLRRTAVVDALGRRTELEYDARGNCVAARRPDGASLSLTYDAADRAIEMVDYAGGVWTRSYDERGLLRERIDPLGRSMQLSYDARGLLSCVRNHDGTEPSCERNAAGLIASFRDHAGCVTKFGYDSLGRLCETLNDFGNRERLTRDSEGRVVQASGSAGQKVQFTWNAEGDLISAADTTGPLVQIAYGGWRRRISVARPGSRLNFHYDSEQQITAIENAGGEIQRYRYDCRGHIAAVERFGGECWKYEHDALGRIVATIRPSGDRVERGYDLGGRVNRLSYPDGTADQFVYRPDGELMEASNDETTVRFERDVLGHIVREWQGDHWIATELDASGRRASVTSSFATRQATTYGPSGEAERISVTGPHGAWSTTLLRDERGGEFARTLPGGLRAEWQRDARGMPIGRSLYLNGTRFAHTRYEWAPGDQLMALETGPGCRTRYRRDDFSRLFAAEFADGSVQYRLRDRLGNVFADLKRRDREYGPSGRLRSHRNEPVEYDPDGRCVRRSGEDGRWSYEYDGAGRLQTAIGPGGVRISFGYDALGRRVRKTGQIGTTRWIWDRAMPLHELSPDGGEVTWIFDPGSFAPAAMLSSKGRFSIVADHLGAPAAMFDEKGTLAWQAQLDLYGNPRHTTAPRVRLPWRWAGQYADAETGLHYNRFRYYDPSAGQYLTPDPIGLAGGGGPYGYVADPLISTDPLGMEECTPYYHGTTQEEAERLIAKGIDLDKGRPNLDFNPWGEGAFYVTRDPEQAARWAAERAAERGGEPAVVRFDVPNSELAGLDRKTFPSADGDWADFVRNSRSGAGGPEHHPYDLVEGPFVTNPKDAENPMSSTPLRGKGDQTAVCSPRAAGVFDRSSPHIE